MLAKNIYVSTLLSAHLCLSSIVNELLSGTVMTGSCFSGLLNENDSMPNPENILSISGCVFVTNESGEDNACSITLKNFVKSVC